MARDQLPRLPLPAVLPGWCGPYRRGACIAPRRHLKQVVGIGLHPAAKVPEAIEHNITVALFDPELAQNYLDYVNIHGGTLHAHLKVETGMGALV